MQMGSMTDVNVNEKLVKNCLCGTQNNIHYARNLLALSSLF